MNLNDSLSEYKTLYLIDNMPIISPIIYTDYTRDRMETVELMVYVYNCTYNIYCVVRIILCVMFINGNKIVMRILTLDNDKWES